LDALFSRLNLIDVHQDFVRNIVSLRISEDLFDDLSPNPDDQQLAIRTELAAKPPQYQTANVTINRPFDEADWMAAVQFPFDHWSQSRYSDGRFGVWYGADSLETSIHETAYHWRQFRADAGLDQSGAVCERKVWSVRCDAALIDLRQHIESTPELVHPSSYALTQQIGARLHREGHPGLLTRSARCAGEVCAVLNPAVISNPRALCYLTYRLTGSGVEVERQPGAVWMAI
jgi:hypothetical protein